MLLFREQNTILAIKAIRQRLIKFKFLYTTKPSFPNSIFIYIYFLTGGVLWQRDNLYCRWSSF